MSTYQIGNLFGDIELHNLRSDPRDTTNLVNKYPEVVAQIRKLVEKEKNALGKWTNKEPEARQTILIEKPKPLKKR